MISEGSCDTEDWSNDAENSALHHMNKLRFKNIKIENNTTNNKTFNVFLDHNTFTLNLQNNVETKRTKKIFNGFFLPSTLNEGLYHRYQN